MALDLPLPETIFAHGWWTVDGEKMSKSRGNVVDPNKMVDEFGADAFRYFLLREVPFGQDGDFSQAAMIARTNSDLANGIGNLLSRTLTMIEKYCGGQTPRRSDSVDTVGNELETQARTIFEAIHAELNQLQFHRALELIWSLVHSADEYIEAKQPWKLAKDPANALLLEGVLYNVAEALRLRHPTSIPIYAEFRRSHGQTTWSFIRLFQATARVLLSMGCFAGRGQNMQRSQSLPAY